MIARLPSADCCDYCGLPVSGAAEEDRTTVMPVGAPLRTESTSPASAGGERYCCFGCRFAAAIARDQEGGATGGTAAGATMARLGLAVFLSMNVMVATMFLWSQSEPGKSSLSSAANDLFRYLCLLFSVPVLLLLGGPLLADAWREIRGKRLSSSLLLVVGVSAAFGYSVYSVVVGGPVYFEVACMVLVAVTLGRYLEAVGKLRTTRALRTLEQLLPDRVRLVIEDRESLVPLASIQPGDLVRVLPGERVPVDGPIVVGRAAIDEQLVTGESVPVEREAGDTVHSGTLNLDGCIVLRAAAAPGMGTLETLVASVLAAVARKDRYQRLADRIAAWFLPAVVAVATATYLVHSLVFHDPVRALFSALAVVVIACPCALGLATPMAIWAAFGRAARAGVLIHSGEVLARLAGAKVVALDKTGTLTTGTASVEQIVTTASIATAEALAIAATLAKDSPHPLARAIVEHNASESQGKLLQVASAVRTISGRGVVGSVVGISGPAYLGSAALMQSDQCAWPNPLPESWRGWMAGDRPLTFLGWQGEVRAVFAFREELRRESVKAVAQVKALGLDVVLLTGDRPERAAVLAAELGIRALGGLSPAEKMAEVERLQHSDGPVVMVGDGINDAPALAAADVGIALGCGADVSRFTAGVCLLGNDLSRVAWTIGLARQTRTTIRWNLFWAFFYNTAGIAIAAAGWLNPILAAMAMVVSSLLVVANSLRLAEDDEQALAGAATESLAPSAEQIRTPVEQQTLVAAEGGGR